MKIAISFIAIVLFFISSNAQSQTISKEEYEKIFQFAVSKTNTDYPVIFSVVTTLFKNGKTVSTETSIVENESESSHRSKLTILEDGKERNIYQITTGFRNVFCSDDGVKWNPPSQYECRGINGNAIRLYAPRVPESSEYSVTTKSAKGKKVKVYREYSVFPPFKEGQIKKFRESISTIDSRGFFITVEGTEGTLDPKIITLTRKQSWITKAKIKPIGGCK
jgi:hypothetical protein